MIAVDASIALKLVLAESDSAVVCALWEAWAGDGEVLVAPVLFRSETLSTIRGKVYRGLLTESEGDIGYEVLANLTVDLREPADLYQVAWDMAKRFNRPTVYDCCYLALAAITGCELWTADWRLANAVRPQLSFVRLLGS